MTREERQTLIDRYAEGGAVVAKSLENFPQGLLTAHPLPGKWSAREIVHHLADSESVSGYRLRKLLAEEHPIIQGYNQEHYAKRFAYNQRDHRAALALFQAVRDNTLQVLRTMNDADWERRGWHSESGLYDAQTWLRIYAAHAHDHAGQIDRLREAVQAAGRA